ncbi:AbrB/MazE/SpoVT family DNA-binding domain-containing protein [Thermococcus sp. SY098]|uniref:AbrB/MazE/SpoVT family DNA-binding domain-containing protein n=1 Tax=Thermococcus sp. SY098 TaxID=3111325 RepID=UPI002D7737EF|nr:AbrB/MazE/SpoVT family DNA-binding domain-containing protein [Thermococcus sp. SY098]WRS53780.1 AbrB/MazE/SpoVT family DNA-binding domain-containing protein [Thermococcus sp. SY098]
MENEQKVIKRIELEKPIPVIAKVISSGRISIPKDIRDLLELKEGDYVVIEIKGIVKAVNHEVKVIEP